MDMDFSIDIIIYALEKNTENEIFDMWKLQFPNMTKESYISFEEYKAKLISKKHTEISCEDIEREIDKVVKAYEEGR